MQKLKGQEDTIMSEAKNPPKYRPKMWKVKSRGECGEEKRGKKRWEAKKGETGDQAEARKI